VGTGPDGRIEVDPQTHIAHGTIQIAQMSVDV